MRLAQKMIVGGTVLLDHVANWNESGCVNASVAALNRCLRGTLNVFHP
jgi:hypothetical protein